MAGMFDDLIPQAPQNPYGNAIGGIESGGRYDAMGPTIPKTGDRAHGKYQVMGANIGPWSKEVLGRELTPQEFIASPEAQEAVFNAKFGSYVNKYGPEGAARAWFAGEKGMNNPNSRDVLGTSVADYSRKFQAASGPTDASSQGRGTVSVKPYTGQRAAPALSFDDLIPQQQNAPLPQAGPQEAPPATFNDRFGGMDVTPAMRLSVENQNQQIAGSQGTTPQMDLQRQNLLSDQVFENDAGFAVFRDPKTNQLVEADRNQHVVLRDPQDNRLKVFVRSEATNENPAVSVSRVLAPGLASGAPTARAMIPAANAVKPIAPTREALKEAAKGGFDAFRNSGVEVPAAQIQGLSREIGSLLNADGFLDVLAPKTFGVLQKLESIPGEAATTSASQLHAIRRTLGRVAGSPDPTEKAAASEALRRFDEFLGTIPEAEDTLKPAMGNYAAAKRSEQVGVATDRADLQAGSAGSGSNIDNATRQQIKSILNNPKKLRGFSSEEIAQMNKIVRGTSTGNVARLLGKLAPTGIVSGGLSGGAGMLAGGTTGAIALPLVGFAAKKFSDMLTMSQVSKLDELIRSRSPLGKQMESSLADWNGKINDLAKAPAAPKVAQAVLATRNLVNNLKDAGIVISPGEFIKAIQGPMRGRAEEE